MNRAKAITLIVQTWIQRDVEFCVGSESIVSSIEMVKCLLALGVSEDELEEYAPHSLIVYQSQKKEHEEVDWLTAERLHQHSEEKFRKAQQRITEEKAK